MFCLLKLDKQLLNDSVLKIENKENFKEAAVGSFAVNYVSTQ